jgi:arylsulfatase A-like enzyme
MKSTIAILTLFSPFIGVYSSEKPNILWLTSEDHGIEMGCYGDTLASTPNVDALAAKGMIFSFAWSNAPVCAPARTAIISGMYPSSTGSEHMRSMVSMPEGTKMYPSFLREAGYYCTNNSKEDYNLMKTDSEWDESSGQAHWRNRSEGQPFFAIFNSTKSHESQIRLRPHEQVLNPEKVKLPGIHPDIPEMRTDWAQYYDKVSEADADAGKALKELEEAGLTEETIVFYYGDHGTGMAGGKRSPTNLGLRVPMVVYFPEKWKHLAPAEYKTGAKSDRLVSFVDLAPTLLSIVGIAPPDWMQGNAFAGPYQTNPQAYLHGFRGRMDECRDLVRSISDGRYVYIRNYMPHVSKGQYVGYQFQTPSTKAWRELYDQGKTNAAQSEFWKTPKAPEELYDLWNDPNEINNLITSSEHRNIIKKLNKAQKEHVFSIVDLGFLPEREVYSRSEGITPYDMARTKGKYDLKGIYKAADLASQMDPGSVNKLLKLLKSDDSAIRYWAAMGLLMQGEGVVKKTASELIAALKDPSPDVRIVAANALGEYGTDSELNMALSVLEELIPLEKNGVFVSLSALTVVRVLGEKGKPLHSLAFEMEKKGPYPHIRYSSYIGTLIEAIKKEIYYK